ncbi:selenide,water dikinase [Methylopila capsulata]|uniref:Selenide,water dikinase n=1 Tax=Methylopila capsulata TaxID=61654 RepID=A0A9W6IUC9_9HYPH|nr:selenide, water dikinase SelD [Methylopila capsulata]MBM7850450.1 selenide,water dikinase [Methylopila capsulata]GLK55744.1 hypothetical protein GCM10008170_17630 [Methylopila capsulata]
MKTTAQGPITTDIVLVGGGHAHVHVLRAFAMRPEKGVRLTLVAKELTTPYSGMLPGLIAGFYQPDDIMIDLARLARATGARLIGAAATGLDRANNRLLLEGRPPIAYDLVSFDVGIAPRLEGVAGVERAIAVKPIATFLARFEAFRLAALRPDGPRSVVVAGGGAAGTELALSIARRIRRDAEAAGLDPQAFSFTLLAGGALLQGYPEKVAALFRDAMTRANVTLDETARLAAVEEGEVVLDDGRRLPAEAVFMATAAAPHPITPALGLPEDVGGFIAVTPALTSPADDRVFAVGDCAGVLGQPRPKAGVYAVRQGPALAANLRRAARGKPLKPLAAQADHLSLIGRGDGTAVATRNGYAAAGRWAWTLKDWIDRRWIAMYRDPPAMDGVRGPAPVSEEPAMRCGGCAAKLGPAPLAAALRRLGPGLASEEVILGVGDDAAVIRRSDGALELQTVDVFKSLVDDPYLFGKIAAVHAIGDVFAMGGRPSYALAIAALPPDAPAQQAEALYQMMAGARAALDPLGVSIIGGHTGEGADPAFGLAVTGGLAEGDGRRKGGLTPGVRLVLTKPLGVGVLIAADMRAQAPAAAMAAAWAEMARPLAADVEVLRTHRGRAMTDVTGFGLVGHLAEMLDASRGVAAEIDPAALPLLPEAAELAARGFASTALPQTLANLPRIGGGEGVPAWLKALLFDPQTSGGLLAAVAEDQAGPCVAALHAAGATGAAVIGRIVARDGGPDIRLVSGAAA